MKKNIFMLVLAMSAPFALAASPADIDDLGLHCIAIERLTPEEMEAIKQRVSNGQSAHEIVEAATARGLACRAIDQAARQARALAAAAALAADLPK